MAAAPSPSPEVNRSNFVIKIGGQVQEEMESDIDEIIVESTLHLPDMVTIRLQERIDDETKKARWTDDPAIDFGKPLVVEMAASLSYGGKSGVVFDGEITALEPEFSAMGYHSLVIRGYDKSHRLHFNKRSRTFLNQTDSQIVNTIARSYAPMPVDVDPTPVTYEYVLQNNQTDMEFLSERAARIGYRVFVLDGKLYFKKSDFVLPGQPPELTLNKELRSFRPRMTAARQASKIEVTGWDNANKQAIKGEAAPNAAWNQGGMTKTGGAAASAAFGGDISAVVAHIPVANVSEANALAAGLANDISSEFIEAEGVAWGDPRIKAGVKIKLVGLGTRFSGEYFVTSATHIYNAYNDYEVHFTVSGRKPLTFNELLEHRYQNGYDPHRIHGVVVGIVTNVQDPLNYGRVKVAFPWLTKNPPDPGPPEGRNSRAGQEWADKIDSHWAKVAAPMAGAGRGFLYLPEVNDEVLVAFEHGDVNRPYILGALWNRTDLPPKVDKGPIAKEAVNKGDGTVDQRIIRSREGHMIVLDDSRNQASIYIVDKTGNNSIFIDSMKNAMAIKVQGNLSIDVGGNITINAKGKIDTTANGDMNLTTRQNLNVISTANTDIQARGEMELTGNSGIKLDGVVKLDMSASKVSMKGIADTEIKGGFVRIN